MEPSLDSHVRSANPLVFSTTHFRRLSFPLVAQSLARLILMDIMIRILQAALDSNFSPLPFVGSILALRSQASQQYTQEKVRRLGLLGCCVIPNHILRFKEHFRMETMFALGRSAIRKERSLWRLLLPLGKLSDFLSFRSLPFLRFLLLLPCLPLPFSLSSLL